MKKTELDVNYVAHLARIGLTEKEAEKFSRQLGDVLVYIDKLNRLDTGKTEPTSHVLALKNVFREDKIRPGLPPEKAVENAPDREKNYFRVPRVIE